MVFRVASSGGGSSSSLTLQTNGVANASQTLLNLTNGSNVTITDGGGGAISIASAATALSAITQATGAATVASGNNTGIVWNWANTADSTVAFTFGETSAATGGTSTSGVPNQVLLKLTTLAASTQSPLSVYSRATHVFSISPTTAQILGTAGAASAPTYSFAGSLTSGMYLGGGGTNVSVTVGGFQSLIVTATQVLPRVGSATAPSLTDGSNATTGLFFGANFMGVGDSTSGELMRFVGGTANVRYLTLAAVTFANLPAAANGSMLYCSDCDPTTSPCASVAGKTGAWAFRQNTAWKCF